MDGGWINGPVGAVGRDRGETCRKAEVKLRDKGCLAYTRNERMVENCEMEQRPVLLAG